MNIFRMKWGSKEEDTKYRKLYPILMLNEYGLLEKVCKYLDENHYVYTVGGLHKMDSPYGETEVCHISVELNREEKEKVYLDLGLETIK